MKRTILNLTLAAALPLTAAAKSVVFTLASGTRVYYQLSSANPPQMVIADNGTVAINGQDYELADITCFAYSATDYTGESGTTDGVAVISGDAVTMSGKARVYTADGRLVSKRGSLDGLKAGTYIVTDGTTTIKLRKL